MQHPKTLAWESRLKLVFDRIDRRLERKYGKEYPLHPVRPPTGSTTNPEQDGLFNIGAAFTPGFGSQHGPGYVVDVRMATLTKVPPDVEAAIRDEVASELERTLPQAFPGCALRVERDGPVFKIIGNLDLGPV